MAPLTMETQMRIIKEVEMDIWSLLMEIITQGIGVRKNLMEKEFTYLAIMKDMKEIWYKIKEKDKANSSMQMVVFIRENGKTIVKTAKEA